MKSAPYGRHTDDGGRTPDARHRNSKRPRHSAVSGRAAAGACRRRRAAVAGCRRRRRAPRRRPRGRAARAPRPAPRRQPARARRRPRRPARRPARARPRPPRPPPPASPPPRRAPPRAGPAPRRRLAHLRDCTGGARASRYWSALLPALHAACGDSGEGTRARRGWARDLRGQRRSALLPHLLALQPPVVLLRKPGLRHLPVNLPLPRLRMRGWTV